MNNPKPIFGVNLAIIQDEKFLLTRCSGFEILCMPGDEMEAGETQSQAAMREASES
jgi:ADP-ribose pyrophosphatase YjhB (NUDIX family)